MKNNKLKMLLGVALLWSGNLYAQKIDTLRITPTDVNSSVLKEGTHRYLVYFKMKKDSVRTETQFWTRQIRRTMFENKPVIEINQEWEDKDSVMHVVRSIADAKTMQPIYHKTWWKVRTSRTTTAKSVNEVIVDFTKKTVRQNGQLLSDTTTNRQGKAIWAGYKSSIGKYFLNWHADLETFPTLPYKPGLVFEVPFYDPGTGSNYQKVIYTVKGSAELIGYNDQKIDCWLLVHESPGNKEVFWISKKNHEVLKLEQEISGGMYRYKIKLGFSI